MFALGISNGSGRYGDKTFSLWERRSNLDECRRTLKAIAGVAQDTTDRLSAEFRDQDLHASFVALDLEAWQIALDWDGSSKFTGPAYAKPVTMAGAIRRIFDALGLEYVATEWGQVFGEGV